MRSTIMLAVLGILLAALTPVVAGAEGFKVTLLGTGTPAPRIDRFSSSTLVEVGEEKLLFDCGRGVTIRLWELKIPMRTITATFLTHLHSDHVVGLPDLWLTSLLPPLYGQRTKPFRIWGPTGTKEMTTYLEKAFAADRKIRIDDEKIPPEAFTFETTEIQQGVVYERNGVKVTAFDVDHGDYIKPSLGYRIDYGRHSVVLSGDTRYSENLIKFAKGADVLIHEVGMAPAKLLAMDTPQAAAARRIIGHHTTPEEAGKVFEQVKPKLAVYSHLVLTTTDPAFKAPNENDVVEATRKTYAGPLEMGEDLMSIDVGDKVEVRRFGAISKK